MQTGGTAVVTAGSASVAFSVHETVMEVIVLSSWYSTSLTLDGSAVVSAAVSAAAGIAARASISASASSISLSSRCRVAISAHARVVTVFLLPSNPHTPSSAAGTEQIVQLLPSPAKDHFCKSCKSDEISGGVKGGGIGWLGSRVVGVLDSGAKGPGFKSQPRRCRVTVGPIRQTVHTHCASVHQAAELIAALLRVSGVAAGLAESNGSLPPVYDSHYLPADCQKPGSAPEPYAR